MKARQDFVMYVNSDNVPVSYKSGDPLPKGVRKITVSKGGNIPQEIEKDIFINHRDYVVVTKEMMKDIPKAKPIVEKRKYSMENLTNLSLRELKKIGAKFKPPITDRSKDKIISEILTAQERIRRTGK